ncbi:MAG: dihydropteroate synthase [Planctomycetes bacterium]|nr:dihydropteroate synthase [Planctomycetota bacterium]
MVAVVEHQDAGTRDRWVIDPARGLVVARPAALMGILNATPDSFSDGGRHLGVAAAVAAGVAMVRDGAAWLDVGGESSRPGAEPVTAAEETARVVPVISALRAAGVSVPISVDTTKASVAEAALAAGASAINDITAGGDPQMFFVVAAHRCPVILMHMQGTPRSMQVAPTYGDVVEDVISYLGERMRAAIAAGIAESALLLDPGIGFGKTREHNLALLRALPRLNRELGRPLVLGISRKSFLTAVTGDSLPAHERDAASHVVHALIAGDCALLRVHDVAGARAALTLRNALSADVLAGVQEGGPHAS